MTAFHDLRVLVVEDEGAIALLIEDMLLDLGCTIAASVGRLADACEMARHGQYDFALLDVNLAGEVVTPVADIVHERGIPFAFSTGYGSKGLPEKFTGHVVVAKPYLIADLERAIGRALAQPLTER